MTGTLRFPIEVGCGVRAAIRRALRLYCFRRQLDCDIQEDRGWLESTYYVVIKGPEESIMLAKRDLEAWFKVVGTEDHE